MKLEDLKAAPYNPRRISVPAQRGLRKSLETFGDLSGIVWNKKTGNLVAGHQRVEQLKAAGAKVKDGAVALGDRRFPVRVVEWSARREKAANLAANHQALQGEFVPDLMPNLVDASRLELTPDDFAALRFDDLPGLTRLVMDGETGADEIPPTPTKPYVKAGELWTLGTHRILCGDSTDPKDVARLMGKDRAGLMNTDPPYGVSYANDERPNPGVAKPRVAKPRVANDGLTGENLQSFLTAALLNAKSVALSERAAWYVWFGNFAQHHTFAAAAAAAAAVILHRQIIWVKPVLLLGRGQYHWKHEPCFMGWVEGKQPPDYGRGDGERNQTTVWEIGGVNQAERREFDHTTPKPVALFEIPIVKHLKPGEIAYEPFAGTGPQIIAAERLGRRCFAIEIEPKYVQVTIERWQAFTGKKAERID